MIRYLENKQIDKQKWDTCISTSQNASIFVCSWYLDVVFPNWSALVKDDYEEVFPLAIKSKYNIDYAFQPFFARYFGVYSKEEISVQKVLEFLEAIPANIKMMEFSLHEANIVQSKLYKISTRRYQALHLKANYDNIKTNYSENAARMLKKAGKQTIEIRTDVSPSTILVLFKTTKGSELKEYKALHYKTLLNLMNVCLERNQGLALGVYQNNELCAAAFFMKFRNSYTYLKGAATEAGKKDGAMYYLFDSFIKQNCEKDIVLDFGGSSVESVANFYTKFGAKNFEYLSIKKSTLPKIVRWIKK